MKIQNSADLGRLYREHGPSVYRRALRLLGNRADAEEALQEVFMRVLNTDSAPEGKGELTGWLYRVTTNYCLNRIRDQKRRRELMQEHVAPNAKLWTASTPVDLLTLRWLLAHGDERQAQAAIYVYLDGLSYDEASSMLGVSRGTIGNLLERFQSFCAEQLKLPAVGPPDPDERRPRHQLKDTP